MRVWNMSEVRDIQLGCELEVLDSRIKELKELLRHAEEQANNLRKCLGLTEHNTVSTGV